MRVEGRVLLLVDRRGSDGQDEEGEELGVGGVGGRRTLGGGVERVGAYRRGRRYRQQRRKSK